MAYGYTTDSVVRHEWLSNATYWVVPELGSPFSQNGLGQNVLPLSRHGLLE